MTLHGEFVETLSGDQPTGWIPGHVTVTLRHGERAAVEAWRHSAFAIHQIIGFGWRLTHAPTGLTIWTFDSVVDAVECVSRIEPLAEWAAITKRMPPGSDLYPKVRAAIDEIEARKL